MRTSTGSPLLIEKQFGQGKVVLFAAPCDRDWSNFPVKPAYLPWVYRLVGYLSQERLAPQPFHRTGDAVPIAVSALEGSPQLLVKWPDGRLSWRPHTLKRVWTYVCHAFVSVRIKALLGQLSAPGVAGVFALP